MVVSGEHKQNKQLTRIGEDIGIVIAFGTAFVFAMDNLAMGIVIALVFGPPLVASWDGLNLDQGRKRNRVTRTVISFGLPVVLLAILITYLVF